MSSLDATLDALVVRAEALGELTLRAVKEGDDTNLRTFAQILVNHTAVLCAEIRERAEHRPDVRRHA